MKKRTILTFFIGTLILFIWNALSWMALPFHSGTFKNIPEQAINMDHLKTEMPESGVYHYPGLPEDQSAESVREVESKLAKGPRVTLMVYKNGPTKFFDPATYGFSLLINFLTVLFAYFVVSKIAVENKRILRVMLLIGVISGLISDISLMNWYLFPLDYTLVSLMDKIIAFTLLGLLFQNTLFGSENSNPEDIKSNL